MSLVIGGVFIGFIASMISCLFGGGAGLVSVPAIYWLLVHHYPNNPHLMQITLATCGAISIPLGLVGSLRQFRYQNVDLVLLKRLLLMMLAGALIAALFITHAKSNIVKSLFSVIILLMAIWMWRYRPEKLKVWQVPMIFYQIMGLLIGLLSVAIGVSTLTVPFLIKSGLDVRKAVGTSTVLVFAYSTLGSTSLFLLGLHKSGLPPYNLSYWNLPILLSATMPSIIASIIAVRLVNTLPRHVLKKLFSLMMVVVALLMMIPH